ncbi:adenine deaminase-2 [Neofusicoccum parvum]|nr:adenine deaminase-2 [Neofusicoccum parvum]
MATLNPAAYYRLDHILGSVTPAKLADLIILSDLREARPDLVIVDGRVVARNNQALFTNTDPIPDMVLDTIHINPHFFEPSAFHVVPRAGQTSAWVQAMEMYDGYFKRAFHVNLPVSSSRPGEVLADTDKDVLKVVVIDRHHSTKNRGIGFVRGFGLQRGAIACTTNCENQNLVVVGTSDAEIASAVRAISSLGGGLAAVCAGEVLGTVKLDVAGCMSSAPWETVRDESMALDEKVRSVLGSTMRFPYLIASFVGLAAVPDLGLTEMGLVAGGGSELMDVILDVENGGGSQHSGEDGVPGRHARMKVCCRCPSHAHDVHHFMDTATALK